METEGSAPFNPFICKIEPVYAHHSWLTRFLRANKLKKLFS